MGLVQDALVGAHCMTQKDVFFDKNQMMDLMMTIDQCYLLPTPAILKPQSLWTGKQAISLILPRITIKQTFKDLDGFVMVQGELLSGDLCKKTLGAASGGIIHQTSKLISPQVALDFMNACQLMCNHFMDSHGFSIGLSDCMTDDTTNTLVQSTVAECLTQVSEIESLASELNIPLKQREHAVGNLLGQVLAITGSQVQKAMKPDNALGIMVNSGSKGSLINIAQITATVGQNTVDGNRIMKKNHPEQRTLNYYPPHCTTPESRGFIHTPYIQGLNPTSFFNHDDQCCVISKTFFMYKKVPKKGGKVGVFFWLFRHKKIIFFVCIFFCFF